MLRLLIVADDMTGALDTGVQLTKRGIPAQVLVDEGRSDWEDHETPVLILAPETRRLLPAAAYQAAYAIFCRAREMGIPYLYKKTDSALRGNVGAELQALSDAYGGERICFAPAFPAAKRWTMDGVLYIGSAPVADSVFGQDPFSPVADSFIPAWLGQKGFSGQCRLVRRGENPIHEASVEVLIFDAAEDEDFLGIAHYAIGMGIRLLAGCAGFAQMLPAILMDGETPLVPPEISMEQAKDPGLWAKKEKPEGLLVFSGSLNPISLAQCRFAVDHGFLLIPICHELLFGQDRECLLEDMLKKIKGKTGVVFYTAEIAAVEDMQAFSSAMGRLAKQIFARFPQRLRVVVGGDTLMAFLQSVGVDALIPLQEIEAGVVLAKTAPNGYPIVTKSGGLGSEDVFLSIQSAFT